jgi:hypothetical protein
MAEWDDAHEDCQQDRLVLHAPPPEADLYPAGRRAPRPDPQRPFEQNEELEFAEEMSKDECTNKVHVFSFAMIRSDMAVGKKAFPDSLSRGQVMERIIQGKQVEIPDTVLLFTKPSIKSC